MAKEQFFYSETRPLFKKLEELTRRSGVSRGQAFEDWLTAMVCALAAETMEERYLTMVQRHKKGKPGQRGIDLIPQMFGELVQAMDQTDADILGDLFEGAITYGENGLYLTPAAISELMARLTIDPAARSEDGAIQTISDCCCGTGRMLLEASKINPDAQLVGQDIDARCAKITAVNLSLRGKYGWVVCGDTLSGETQFAYRIGSFFHEGPGGLRRGVIRNVPPESTPVPVIAQRHRHDIGELFAEQNVTGQHETEPAAEVSLPAMIEVPRWLARLEPQLAPQGSEAKDPHQGDRTSPSENDTSKDEQPPKQQTLF